MSFNINAAVVLSGPKNIAKVRSSIQKQLSNISVPVRVKVDKGSLAGLTNIDKQLNTLNSNLTKLNATAKGTSSQLTRLAASGAGVATSANKVTSATNQINKSLDKTAASSKVAGSQIQAFGKDAALAVRRFAAFSIATGVIFGFTRAITQATSEAIKFERELVKITQVTGRAGKDLAGLRQTIDSLATGLGLNANELLGVARTFAQTGQSLNQVEKSLKAVAKASLAPTFGDIQQTTEGAIAALNQFGIEAGRLESILGSLNSVSKSFAVESDDLISVIRRAGGVFAASSQQLGAPEERLRELIGIFTAVRSTTRESADTIATGLRTIFTRVQRPQTIKFLEQFGIRLRATAEDAKRLGIAEGEFVGIFEALKKISSGLKGLDTLQVAKLVEELGGVRQVGKLLPALRNFEKAERARQVALQGTESITKDVALATQTLSVQIEQLQQRFGKLIRDISESATFQNLAKFAIGAANAFVTLADALRPILPALTALAAVKLTGGVFQFAQGFIGGIRKGGGSGGVGRGISGALTGSGRGEDAASKSAKKQATAAIQKNITALNSNTTALKSLNSSIKSLKSTATSLNTNAVNLSKQAVALTGAIKALPPQLRAATAGGGAITFGGRGRRRRAAGGKIPKFGKGGFVDGPSHAQGGVLALLEGGEAVIPKKDVRQQFPGGGRAYKRKNMRIGGLASRAAKSLSEGKTVFDDLFKLNNAPNAKKPVQLTTGFSKFIQGKGFPKGGAGVDALENLSSKQFLALKSEYRQSLSPKANQKAAAAAKETKKSIKTARFNVAANKFGGLYLVPPNGTDGTDNVGSGGITPTNQAVQKALVSKAKASLSKQGFDTKDLNKVAIAGSMARFIASENDIRSGIDKETREASQKGMEAALDAALKSPSLKIGDPATDLNLSQSQINRAVKPLFQKEKTKKGSRVNSAGASIQGFLLESIVSAIGKITPQSSGAVFDFDFRGGRGIKTEALGDFFGVDATRIQNLVAADAKRSASKGNVTSIFKKTGNYVANKKITGLGSFSAAEGMEIPGRGKVPVAISDGEGLVDPKVAAGNLRDLEKARKGFGSAIDSVANLPIDRVSGPGTGTSDSIKTSLDAGTFVLPASTMKAIDSRRQGLAVGGVVKGVGRAIKQDPGTAAFVGFEAAMLASSNSAEEFKSNLMNAGLTALLLGPQLKQFGAAIKANAAEISKGTGSAKSLAAGLDKSKLANDRLAKSRSTLARREAGLQKFVGRKGPETLEKARIAGRTGKTPKGRTISATSKSGQRSIVVGKELLGREAGVKASQQATARAKGKAARRRLFGRGGASQRAAIDAAQRARQANAAASAARGGARVAGKVPTAGLGRAAAGSTRLAASAPKLAGGPAGIAAIVASIFGDAIVDGVTEATVGKRKQIAGVAGFSAEQGGLKTAGITGAAKGAISGAATGAAIGSLTGPAAVVLTPLLAAIGGITGAIDGALGGLKQQLKFETLQDAQTAGLELEKALDKLAEKGFKDADALDAVTKSARGLTSAVTTTTQRLGNLRVSGRQMGNAAVGGIGSDLGVGGVVDGFAKFSDQFAQGFDLVGKTLAQAEGTGIEGFANSIGGLLDITLLADQQMRKAAQEMGGVTGAVSTFILDVKKGAAELVGIDVDARARNAAKKLNASVQLQGAEDFQQTLAAIPDAALQKATVTFEALGPALANSLNIDQVTDIAALGADASLDDLFKALEGASDGTKQFSAQLEAFKALAGTQAVSAAKTLNEQFDQISAAGEASGRKGKLDAFFAAGKTSAADFIAGINAGKGFEESGKLASKRLISNLNAQTGNAISGLNLGITDIESFQKAIEKNPEVLNKVAKAAGVSSTELSTLVNSTQNYISSVRDSIAAQIAAEQKQRIVNDLLLAQVQGLDAFAAALQDLDQRVANIVSDFTTTAQNVQNEVSRILSTTQQAQAVGRANVFAGGGRGRSREELSAGVERVRRAVGGDAEDFADLPDTIALGNRLPQALKDTVDQIERAGGEFTFEDVKDTLVNNINAEGDIFSGLSEPVKKQFMASLEGIFVGLRQGGDPLGVEGVKAKLGELGDIQGAFSQLSQQAAQNLESITNSLNQLNQAIINSANLIVTASRERANAELEIQGRRADAQDRLSQFRTGGADPLQLANQRLADRTSILLNAGGSGTANVGGVNLGTVGAGPTGNIDLLERRAGLEEIRKGLLDRIGETVGVDTENADDAIAAAREAGEGALVDELGNTIAALEGTKRAIEEQTNETARLSAIESKLSSIQESRLSQRQRLQAGLSQLSGARSQKDVNRILNDIQRPFIAASKVASGQAISVQEGAALQQDLFDDQGIAATAFRQQFKDRTGRDASDKEVGDFLETSLANFQQGGRDLFSNLGLGAGAVDAVLGRADGPGATVKGETKQEKDLISEFQSIVDKQAELIKGSTDQNTKLLQDQQILYRQEIIKTTEALATAGEAFASLRDREEALLALSEKRLAQLEQIDLTQQKSDLKKQKKEEEANVKEAKKLDQERNKAVDQATGVDSSKGSAFDFLVGLGQAGTGFDKELVTGAFQGSAAGRAAQTTKAGDITSSDAFQLTDQLALNAAQAGFGEIDVTDTDSAGTKFQLDLQSKLASALKDTQAAGGTTQDFISQADKIIDSALATRKGNLETEKAQAALDSVTAKLETMDPAIDKATKKFEEADKNLNQVKAQQAQEQESNRNRKAIEGELKAEAKGEKSARDKRLETEKELKSTFTDPKQFKDTIDKIRAGEDVSKLGLTPDQTRLADQAQKLGTAEILTQEFKAGRAPLLTEDKDKLTALQSKLRGDKSAATVEAERLQAEAEKSAPRFMPVEQRTPVIEPQRPDGIGDAAGGQIMRLDVARKQQPATGQRRVVGVGATPGPEEAKVRKRQAEDQAAADKVVADLNLKPIDGIETDDDFGAAVKAKIEADKQAEIDAAREKDRANAAARQQPAAKVAVGNLRSIRRISQQDADLQVTKELLGPDFTGRIAGAETGGLVGDSRRAVVAAREQEAKRAAKAGEKPRTQAELVKAGLLEQEDVDIANKSFKLRSSQNRQARAREKQIAAEARDPRKRTRRLADLEKEQRAQANRKKLLEEKGGFGEKDASRLSELKQTVGPLSEEQNKELINLKARQGLSQRIDTGSGRIQRLGGTEQVAAQQQQEAAQLNKQKNEAQAKQITQEQTDLKKNQQLQQQKQQQQQQEIQQAPTAAGTQDPTAKFVQAVEMLNTSTFATELLAAATKLESLPDINITLNSEPIDVNVILNGGQLLAEFRKEFQDQIFDEVANQIAANNSNIDGGQPVV
tara:strand:- start:2092 stop:12003 length:9912 start_codon:yes stop_codon:yes gene_type:complete